MKTFLKIIFNIIVYPILWWFQYIIILSSLVGLGLWDSSGFSVGSTPGLVSLLCFYTSYLILKKIHKIIGYPWYPK
tara:strand:+ start:354 stop:581 length:228 start_codon:yes stop_codon:yes gene_type:complete